MGKKIPFSRSFLRFEPLAQEYVSMYNMAYITSREVPVQRLKPTRDIQPVSEFRANAAKFIEQVRATKEPVILTQHGRGAAVLVDIESYEQLLDELELRRAIERSDVSIREGRGIPHEDVMKELRARFGV
jgi:antitoxin YefM